MIDFRVIKNFQTGIWGHYEQFRKKRSDSTVNSLQSGWRHRSDSAGYSDVDNDRGHFRYRQRRGADGMLFSHAFPDVRHGCSAGDHGYHTADLHRDRHGGDRRECVE